MAFLLNVFIAAAVLTTVLGQSYNINLVTNGTQDYFRIAQAELLLKIKFAEMEDDAVDARFLDRLTVIEMQQQQVLNETQQVNQTFIPLQALSFVRKYCIQTYDSQFITHKNAKEQYKMCIVKAQNIGSSLTASARSSTKTAKNYATNTLPRNVQNCQSYSYNNNQTKIDQCYIDYVQTAVKFVQSNLDKADFYRKQSIFEMDGISLSAVQCSFDVEKVVLEAMALTSTKINDCVNALQKNPGFGNKNALN